jgi:hypothetical protein
MLDGQPSRAPQTLPLDKLSGRLNKVLERDCD